MNLTHGRFVAGLTLFLLFPLQLFSLQQIDPAKYIDRTEVRALVNRYTADDMREWLESTISRGAVFQGFITNKIREYGMPDALVYLPIVESEYNPRAVSPSGAAGLWQFMMNSIGPFDMTVDDWVDERKDFWKSTNASLRKLKENEVELGDWLLAIAAYNCGLGRMMRIVKLAKTSDFWELSEGGFLPVETKRYVPKFLAIAYIVENAERYGISLPAFPKWQWSRVEVANQVNLRLLAKLSRIPEELLFLGNAELKYDVTPPIDSSYLLKVPDIYSDVIKRELEGDVLALNRFYIHTISMGDTLYALARHFDIPVDLIMYYNPGIEPRYLRIGSTLLIPTLGKTVVPPLPRQPVARFRRRTLAARHEVQPGDTLWALARKYRVSVNELAVANSFPLDRHLHPGEILDIPIIGGEALVQ